MAAVLVIALAVCNCRAELTPPYFNLAEGRQISATATCGVGVEEPELYCKLVGANTENDVHHNYSLVQGQVNIPFTIFIYVVVCLPFRCIRILINFVCSFLFTLIIRFVIFVTRIIQIVPIHQNMQSTENRIGGKVHHYRVA